MPYRAIPISRIQPFFLAGALALAGPAAPAVASLPPDPELRVEFAERVEGWERGTPGMAVGDSAIAARIEVLRRESVRFDAAWTRLQASGTPILIGTAEELRAILPGEIRESKAWAGITLTWGQHGGAVSRAAVVIRSEWLADLHERIGGSSDSFHAALDELIVHEVYGHLVPLIDEGSRRGQCADPRPDQRLFDSCVGQRVRQIRDERAAPGADTPKAADRLAAAHVHQTFPSDP